MFNSLFAEESGKPESEKSTPPVEKESAGDGSTSTAANPLLNFWSVATAVTNTVKARADELVKSVVDTDWRSELSQFSREVGEESKTLKEKTAELVEHLPEQVVHLPEKAEEALYHLPAQVHLPKDVGQTLEGVSVVVAQFGKSLLQGTKELIDELKDGVETEIAAASREGKRAARGKTASSTTAKLSSMTGKYNRFEAEVAAMQRDSSTYCDEPEDSEDYNRWKAGFSLEGAKADIARILSENAFMSELQSRLVPIIVEYDDFWHRYFYRFHKLQQKEEQRQQLAQRAKTLQEDDVPLGWGDEDELQPSPRPSDVKEPSRETGSSTAAAEVASSVAPAVANDGDTKPFEVTRASSPKRQSLAVPKPMHTTTAAVKEHTGVEAAPMATAIAEATGAGTVSSAEATESVGRGLKCQSGGGDSGSGNLNISGGASGVDGGHLEVEPHAETSSDSSAKEWCVVSSEAQQAPSETATFFSADGAAEAASSQPPSTSDAEATAELSKASAPVVTVESITIDGGAARKDKAPESGQKTRGAKQAAAEGAEEDVDEDWGNWD